MKASDEMLYQIRISELEHKFEMQNGEVQSLKARLEERQKLIGELLDRIAGMKQEAISIVEQLDVKDQIIDKLKSRIARYEREEQERECNL